MKSQVMQELKNYLKSLAVNIRELKSHRPLKNRGDHELWKLELDIEHKAWLFRQHHIVYCLIRGRSLDQIEQPRVALPSSMWKPTYDRYMERLDREKDTLCPCS